MLCHTVLLATLALAAPAPKTGPTDRHGDPLPPGAITRVGTTRLSHGKAVTAVVFSIDGKTLVSTGLDGRVCLWEVRTGRAIRTLNDQSASGAHHVAITPDGKTVAALVGDPESRRGDVCFWEAATGKQVERVEGPAGGFTAFALSPDGKTLAASSGATGTIVLVDWATRKELTTLDGHKGPVCALAFSTDGKRLASASQDNTVRVWDKAAGLERCQRTVPVKDNQPRDRVSLAFSPDDKLLAVGTSDKLIRLLDPVKGNEVGRCSGHEHAVVSLCFTPDGKTLASAGWDKTIRLWDPATGKELRRLAGLLQVPNAVAVSPDGKVVASGGHDHMIRLWDTTTGQEARTPPGDGGEMACAALSPDGKTLATVNRESSVRLWDVATGKDRGEVHGHRGWGWRAAFSPDGKTLASAAGLTIYLWDAASKKEGPRLEHKLATGRGTIRFFSFSRDGKKITTTADDGVIRVWDVATGKELEKKEGGRTGTNYGVSPDGKIMAFPSSRDVSITLWDVAAGKELHRLKMPTMAPNYGVFSPDGKLFAAPGFQTPIRVWEVATGKELYQFGTNQNKLGKKRNVLNLCFSPDSKMLASAEDDNTVRLWEMATGKERPALEGHRGPVQWVNFAADGTTLASGSADTTALVWDLTGRGREVQAGLTPKELAPLWDDLADADAARAFQAIQKLTASPGSSVSFLQEKLRPSAAESEKKLAELIRGLDSDRFEVREKASKELASLGEAAEPALRTAAEQGSEESRSRAKAVLESIATARASERLRALRAIEVVEHAGTAEARKLLKELAGGAPAAWLTKEAQAALDRLAHRPTPEPPTPEKERK